MITTGSQTSQITPNWNKKPLTTILAINCGKTIIWNENSLVWTPLPSALMFFSAGLQENNFKVGGEGGLTNAWSFFCLFVTNLWQRLSERAFHVWRKDFFNCISSVTVRSDICCVYVVWLWLRIVRYVCDVIIYAGTQQALFIKQKNNESGAQARF